MNKRELIQYIGNEICEGCGPDEDCGIDPDECERIENAESALDDHINELLEG